MGASLLKIVAIIFIAAVIAFLVNYMQPDGLPLFNKDKYGTARVDENLNPPPSKQKYPDYEANDTLQQDRNKMALEKNRIEINEDLLPSYDYKSDSDLDRNANTVLPDQPSNSGDVVLSNLTTDVFNQPRLISLAQALELYRDKVLFIDARDQEQYNEGHIAGAINIPYFSVDDFIGQLSRIDKYTPLVTYCEGADCDMSIRLGDELFKKGYRKVFVYFGGWEEWRNADYPIVSSNETLQLN